MSEMRTGAARPFGRALLFQAQSALYDEIADQTIAIWDDVTGLQGEPTYTPGSIADDSGWTIDQVTDGPHAGTSLFRLRNAAGTETFVNFATGVMTDGVPAQLTPAQAQAAVDDANAVAAEPDGPSVLSSLPDTVLDAADDPSRNVAYDAANAPNRAAIHEYLNRPATAPTRYVRRAVIIANGRQDRSRVSKEYHEWRYCVVTSGDYERIATFAAGKGIAYVGADKLILESTAWAPPYHRWIQFDDFRELIKIYRRFKRARNSCGGKNLWSDQGFADKEAAIKSDCENDTEFQSLVSGLAAESEWSLTT